MNRKESMNKNFIIISILTAFLVLGFIVGCQWSEMRSEAIHTSDTVFQTRVDTVKYTKDTTIYEKIPKYIEKIRVDTVFDKNGDTLKLEFENKLYQDTLTCAEDSIILQNFISGISSKRDSIKANWKRQEKIITNTITIEKYIEKRKRINFGPSITAGYDPINRNFGIMIGIGGTIDIK